MNPGGNIPVGYQGYQPQPVRQVPGRGVVVVQQQPAPTKVVVVQQQQLPVVVQQPVSVAVVGPTGHQLVGTRSDTPVVVVSRSKIPPSSGAPVHGVVGKSAVTGQTVFRPDNQRK